MAIQQNFPAIKPTLLLDFANVEALDPRVTFTRASTATYYGTQVAMAEQNLLRYSQEFDVTTNGWARAGNASVTANNEAAPDGTQTADTISFPQNTSRLTQTLTVQAGDFVASVFLKGTAGETSRIELGGVSNPTQVTFTGEWQRVTVSASLAAGSTTFVLIRRIASGDTAASFAAWGAQLEQRSTVTAYTPTTTQPITNYIPVLQTAAANVARFDHSPTTFESLGLEIEEQRTNLLLRSEEFNYATWAKNDLNVTSNTVVAPNGELTGDKLVENTASSFHLCNQAFTVTNATTYTFSVFLKAAERGFAFVGYNTGSLETTFVSVNLSLGTISTAVGTPVASSIQNVGNGWYRVSITLTSTGTNYSQADIRTSVDGVWANRNYTGDGYSGIYVWGAQLEVGAFPTSYIKTEASQVTRSADAASMTGANFSSWYRADEGTLFAQTQRTGTNDTSNEGTGIEITSGEFQKNLLQLMYDSGSFNRPKLRIISNVSADVNGVSGSSPAFVYGEPPAMFAAAYKSGDSGLSKGGSTVTTSTTAFLPPVVSFLSIKTTSNGSQGSDFNGYIRKIAYYPLRLTNAQLQALTS